MIWNQPGWQRFAGPKATSQSVVLPVLIFLSLNSAPTGLTQNSDIRLIQLRIIFFALVLSWTYFTVSGYVLNKVARGVGKLRIILVLWIFASTEILRTVLVHEFALLSGLDSEPYWIFRICAGAMTGIVFFGISSVVINDSLEYRRSYNQLVEQRLKLNATIASTESMLRTVREQLVAGIKAQLVRALSASVEKVSAQEPRTEEVSEELFRVTEEVVRPLSHSLFEKPIIPSFEELEIRAPRIPLKQLISDATSAEPFRPALLVFVGLMLTFPVSLLFRVPLDWLMWLGAFALTFVVIWFAKIYLTEILRTLPISVRVLLFAAVYIPPAFFFSYSIMDTVMEDSSNPVENFIYGYGIIVFLGSLLAVISGMRQSRQRMLDEVSAVNNQLYHLSVRLQAETWLHQKNLALALHNDVQSTLLSAALKLNAASKSGNISQEDLSSVKELIFQSMNFAASEISSTSLSEVVNRLNSNWAGLITMTYSASKDAEEALAQDVVTLGIVDDVLTEFHNNSLKHGAATETSALLTIPEPGVLKLEMFNNGKKIPVGEFSPGLGSAFLQSVCLSIQTSNKEGGVEQILRIPIVTNI